MVVVGCVVSEVVVDIVVIIKMVWVMLLVLFLVVLLLWLVCGGKVSVDGSKVCIVVLWFVFGFVVVVGFNLLYLLLVGL